MWWFLIPLGLFFTRNKAGAKRAAGSLVTGKISRFSIRKGKIRFNIDFRNLSSEQQKIDVLSVQIMSGNNVITKSERKNITLQPRQKISLPFEFDILKILETRPKRRSVKLVIEVTNKGAKGRKVKIIY